MRAVYAEIKGRAAEPFSSVASAASTGRMSTSRMQHGLSPELRVLGYNSVPYNIETNYAVN